MIRNEREAHAHLMARATAQGAPGRANYRLGYPRALPTRPSLWARILRWFA